MISTAREKKLNLWMKLLFVLLLLASSTLSNASSKEYQLRVANTWMAPAGGKGRVGVTVNEALPGTPIRIVEGEQVTVTVVNKMTQDAISVHFHGLHQRGTPWMDGVGQITQCAVLPGQVFRHTFTVDAQFGTYFWHGHVGVHLADGLAGAFIVDSPRDPIQMGTDYSRDHVALMQEWLPVDGDSMLIWRRTFGWNDEPLPDALLINGKGRLATIGGDGEEVPPLEVFAVDGGSAARFRFINNGPQANKMTVTIDEHTMRVVAADGYPLREVAVRGVELAIGQRIDVLVDTNAPTGSYWLRATSDTGPTTGLAIVRYEGAPPLEPTSTDARRGQLLRVDDKRLRPLWPQAVAAVADHEVPVSMANVGQPELGFDRWAMNGISYAMPPVVPAIVAPLDSPSIATAVLPHNKQVRIVLQNESPLPHPMHMHGHSFFLLGTGSGVYNATADAPTLNTVDPLRRDTFKAPPSGWAVLHIVSDNPGVWLLHCHRDFHLAEGQAMLLVEAPDQLAKMILLENPFICNNPTASISAVRMHRMLNVASPSSSLCSCSLIFLFLILPLLSMN
jgi:FtsP/CotA-like multicopper oxidase with cupredoxin domain